MVMRRALVLLLSLWSAACGSSGGHDAVAPSVGTSTLFTITNGHDANEVVAFALGENGSITEVGRFGTGGLGVGGGLENQGAVTVTEDRKYLLAVNPGSGDVSALRITEKGLQLTDRVQSSGPLPVSVTERGGLIYVLTREGDDGDSISGLRLQADGRLSPIAGSTGRLSAPGTAAAQVSLSRDGRFLVVTERALDVIDVFTIDGDGLAANRHAETSAGQGPFGFAFRNASQFYVSEAGSRSASAYALDTNGALQTLSRAVRTDESATCWLAISPDGRTAFVANTGSGTISGFAIAADGTLSLTRAVAATTPGGPLDLAITGNGRYLSALTTTGSVATFRIESPGSDLTPTGVATGLPAGSTGLAGF